MKNIETLVREMEVPVIVKEVGFGMSRETVAQLASAGVQTIDVSGTGERISPRLKMPVGPSMTMPI